MTRSNEDELHRLKLLREWWKKKPLSLHLVLYDLEITDNDGNAEYFGVFIDKVLFGRVREE